MENPTLPTNWLAALSIYSVRPVPATSTSTAPQPANAMSCCCSVVPVLLSILPCKTSPRSCVPLVASGKAERLCITPQMLSKIRKNISFGAQK